MIREGTMMMVEGKSRWVEVDMIAWNNDDFAAIGDTYEEVFPIERGMVGLAESLSIRTSPYGRFCDDVDGESSSLTAALVIQLCAQGVGSSAR